MYQPTLVQQASDTTVKLPSNLKQWQVVRDESAPGVGSYYAYNKNGVKEPIGGPGLGSGVPFANDTDILPNAVQVAIPGAALTDGYLFEVNILTTNTGASTLQVNALGVKNIVDSDGNALVGGELVNESIYLFAYDLQNDRYQLLGLAKPSPDDIWELGTGLESAQQINTLFPNDASGDYSVATGSGTEAIGDESFSQGNNTTASGQRSFASGANSVSSGDNAHAEGTSTLASGPSSHAEGTSTQATQDSAHAEGSSTIASGTNSHAEGDNTQASSDNTHTEGRDTVASAPNSHAEGQQSQANGDVSHAEGFDTEALGNNSHSEGSGTLAGGVQSHAEGFTTQALGDNSHAEGQSTTVSPAGTNAHAEGLSTQAQAPQAHAEGNASIASGDNSHAGGLQTTASGLQSFNHSEATAPGGSNAQGDNSFIAGGLDNNIDAASDRSVALGGSGNNIVGEPDTAQAQNLRTTGDFRITQGVNKNAGVSAALVGGTLVVAHNNVKAGAVILLTRNTPGGVIGNLSAPTAGIIADTSFTINSDNIGETSTVNYLIINP